MIIIIIISRTNYNRVVSLKLLSNTIVANIKKEASMVDIIYDFSIEKKTPPTEVSF